MPPVGGRGNLKPPLTLPRCGRQLAIEARTGSPHASLRQAGLRLAFAAIGLLLATGVAAAAAADAYDLVEGWDLDFLHAGNDGFDANYAELMGGGACVLDYDADGWEDLFLTNGRYADRALDAAMNPRSALYRNDNGTGFLRVPGALDVHAWGMGCAAGDYDADGDADVAMTTWGSVLLYRNDGGGVFTNVTGGANLWQPQCGSAVCFGASVAWLDFDLDFDLDLYALNYVAWDGVGQAAPVLYPGQCNQLYRNNGDGTFTDVASAAGAADCGLNHLAVAIADVDADFDPDLFIASDETVDSLLLNDGDGTFTDVSASAGVADRRGGMGAAWGDYDEDGKVDLVITHYDRETFALYRQNDALNFTDRATPDGLAATRDFVGWGVEFADLNLDGHLDLVFANGHVNRTLAFIPDFESNEGYAQRSLVYFNDGAGAFDDVTEDVWHPAPVPKVTRGLALADFDRDGYLDLALANNPNSTTDLWRSARGPNNFLAIRLAPAAGDTPHALGAKVTVEAGGRRETREVVSATSYLSQSTRDLHFGLGRAENATRVTVRWPDGTTDVLANVPANRHLVLSPGGAVAVLADRPVARALTEGPIFATRLDDLSFAGEIARAPSPVTSTEWRFGGAAVAGSAATHRFASLGEHRPAFRVTDATGAWDEDDVRVVITNIAPEPALATPATIGRGVTLRLDASGSTDADGFVARWRWLVAGVPHEGPVLDVSFPALGTVTIDLEVEDSDGGRARIIREVEVVNARPVADAGADALVNVDAAARLDGRASVDPDGAIVAWAWDLGNGATAQGPTVDARYAAPGVYVATLTVTDDLGATASDTVRVTVHTGVPVPAFEAPARVTRAADATFDATASADPDGVIVSYAWSFGDGGTASGAVVAHRFLRLGDHDVALTVTDDAGNSARLVRTVLVSNLAPVVDAGPDLAQEGLAPVAFSMTAADADGRIVGHAWDFGDGTRAATASASHAFARYGRYVATASAFDDDGASGTATRAVWLYAKPVAVPGPDRDSDRLTTLAFDARASSDADGAIVGYHWDFGDGTTAEGPIAEHRYAALGTFTVTLAVLDDDGFAASATALVRVRNLPPEPAIDARALANVDQLLAYDARASVDPDGDVVAWTWDFAGAMREGARVEHAFAATGARAATLTITDSDGASASATLVVDVVDWLAVDVRMAASSFTLGERPRGVVAVAFANGLPAAGAHVDVELAYRARLPAILGPDTITITYAILAGETDEAGFLAFEARWPLEALDLLPPTLAAGPGTEHVATARATWSANAGEAEAAYRVTLGPALAVAVPGRR